MARERLLTETFVELSDTLVDDFDTVELLTVLAKRTVELLDVSAAGIVLIDPTDQLRVIASSEERMRMVELFEVQSDEGPCRDCYRSGSPVVNESLEMTEDRWPDFAARAREAGFTTVHALPMRLRGQTIGALNLFDGAAQPLADDDQSVGQALADVATISILQHQASQDDRRLTEQLSTALESRVVIEQAKGVLAEQAQLDMEDAFEAMRRYARSRSERLSVVATALIDGSLEGTEMVGAPDEVAG